MVCGRAEKSTRIGEVTTRGFETASVQFLRTRGVLLTKGME
jgi:hypothetical protein